MSAVRVVVMGAAGRMGQRVVAAVREAEPAVALAGGVERSGHAAQGADTGSVAGVGATGVLIGADPEAALRSADVAIDFTQPEASLETARTCARLGKAAVIGTTGHSTAHREELLALSRSFPLVLSPNMSVGVNLLFAVLPQIARALGEDYDVEVVEAHHRLKKDAPSGTALRLAEVVAEALGRDLGCAVYGRQGQVGERTRKEIGLLAVRMGDVVGDHSVYFAAPGEVVEIAHRATSRDAFARGAVRAARWVATQPPGRYDMVDVLGLRRAQGETGSAR